MANKSSTGQTAQARQIANEAELAHGDRCFFKVRVNACECDLGKRRQRLESAILAALTSASAAKDWQPIATAPKDGTLILVYYREGGIVPRRFACPRGHERPRWVDALGNDAGSPTHWMPLPDPPSESR